MYIYKPMSKELIGSDDLLWFNLLCYIGHHLIDKDTVESDPIINFTYGYWTIVLLETCPKIKTEP